MLAVRQTENLSRVFGAFAHDRPDPPRTEFDSKKAQSARSNAYKPDPLPVSPDLHKRTGVVKSPSKRVDGSVDDPPWNAPENVVWSYMRNAPIEFIEERCLDGVGGAFWARYRNHDGTLKSAMLRLDGMVNGESYRRWGAEYLLSEEKADLLKRELASYEVAKAMGMEDMVAPVSARDINVVPLISDAVREKIASELRISTVDVDNQFHTVGLLHALPINSTNFAEKWGTLGPDDPTRWKYASNRLRHSIYRAMALDFVLGTGDRLLCSLCHIDGSDTVGMKDFGVTFPNPSATADKYMRNRLEGWGRRPLGPTEGPMEIVPPHLSDLMHLSRFIPEDRRDECLQTFAQVTESMEDDVVGFLVHVLKQHGVPRQGIHGFLARLMFLQIDPIAVMSRPHDFVKSVLVPARRGYGFDSGRNKMIVDYVNNMSTITPSRPFDFAASMQRDRGLG